jgi:hypothetical protein
MSRCGCCLRPSAGRYCEGCAAHARSRAPADEIAGRIEAFTRPTMPVQGGVVVTAEADGSRRGWQGGEGFVNGAAERYETVQAGDAEQLPGLVPVARHVQGAAVGRSPAGGKGEHAQPGGSDEGNRIEVDDEGAAAGPQRGQALAQLVCGADVNVPGHDDKRAPRFPLYPNGQRFVHGNSPSLTRCGRPDGGQQSPSLASRRRQHTMPGPHSR